MIELSIVAPSQMWQLGPIMAGPMIVTPGSILLMPPT